MHDTQTVTLKLADKREVLRGITGEQLRRAMRSRRVTVAELARRLDVPQWKVRSRRQTGVAFPACLDWMEAIRGTPGLTDRERAQLAHWRNRE